MIKLEPLKREYMETLNNWRLESRDMLRTPLMKTLDEQISFYEGLLKPYSEHKYYAIIEDSNYPDKFIGCGGIINISWINRNAEISLIIDTALKRKGYGTKAVRALLNEAFKKLNLQNIYGECYYCNPNIGFWEYIAKTYNAYTTMLPERKYLDGRYYGSFYFSISAAKFD